MFETFVVSEIIKSFTNEGKEYDFNLFYYREKDKLKSKTGGVVEERESEIDLMQCFDRKIAFVVVGKRL